IGHFRRVRNETEDRVIKVVVDCVEDLRTKRRAESFALLINVRVVSARKIDSLKRAGGALARRDERLFTVGSVLFNDDGVSRRNFTNLVGIEIESGHQRRALGGNGQDLVIFEKMTRTNSIRIAKDEHVAVSDQP